MTVREYVAQQWDMAFAVFPRYWEGGLGSPCQVQHPTLADAQREAQRLNDLLEASNA